MWAIVNNYENYIWLDNNRECKAERENEQAWTNARESEAKIE